MKIDYETFVIVCRCANIIEVRQLIKNIGNSTIDERGNSLLINSLLNKDYDITELLVENGVDVNFNRHGSTAIMYSLNNTDALKLLIANGAQVNVDDEFESLILTAMHDRNLEAIPILLDHGAEIDYQSSILAFNPTALMLASELGYYEIAKLLLDRGANIDLKNNRGFTAYNIAKKNGNIDIMCLLKTHNLSINHQDENGSTLLMDACETRHEEFVLLLKDKGADFHIKNNKGQTAYSILKRKRTLTPGLQALKESLVLQQLVGDNDSEALSL